MNKVSEFLGKLGTNGKEYAELVERLVVAARMVVDDANEVGDNNYEISSLCYHELDAALAAIKGGEVGNE